VRLPASFRRNLRLMRIAHILATHGMAALAVRMRLFYPYVWLVQLLRGDELPKDLGAQIRLALEKLGPTFIKFGQMLSTRVDLLPMDVALELKKLQDDVPPEPFARVQRVIESSFKRPLTGEQGLFASFNEVPVAAASIAQVHFAELKNGQQVAVKVRRDHISRTIESDLAILQLLAALFDRYFPEYHNDSRRIEPAGRGGSCQPFCRELCRRRRRACAGSAVGLYPYRGADNRAHYRCADR